MKLAANNCIEPMFISIISLATLFLYFVLRSNQRLNEFSLLSIMFKITVRQPMHFECRF
jgi:hypothetical protein